MHFQKTSMQQSFPFFYEFMKIICVVSECILFVSGRFVQNLSQFSTKDIWTIRAPYFRPEHPEKFFNYLNEKHANIKFTLEIENTKSLPFLDIQIVNANSVKTAVYRKSIYSGMGLNFFSVYSPKFKINAINTLLYRAYHLSSDYLLFHKEIEFLKTFFTNNGYPQHVFDTTCCKFLNKMFSHKSTLPTVSKDEFYFNYHIIQFGVKLLLIHY